MSEETQNSYYSSVRAGDLVRITKGETKIEGRVLVANDPYCLTVLDRDLARWDHLGYAIEIVEQGFSALPDGLYIDAAHADAPHRAVVYRNRAGQMTVLNPEHEGLTVLSSPESPVLLVASSLALQANAISLHNPMPVDAVDIAAIRANQ